MDTKKLRQKILDLAIRGKLVPQDPNDEPASVLLERIRAEKQQLIKEGKIKAPKGSKACDTSHYGKIEGPFEIPESWEWCRLGDICHFENGYAFSSHDYRSQGTPLIRISNIQNGSVIIDRSICIAYDVDSRFIISKGDLLIAMSGATTGKMGIYKDENEAYLNQRVGNIKITTRIGISERYRNLFMLSQSDNILKQAYGGAQPNISSTAIEEMYLPLPPISEQKRIVDAVEHIMNLIDFIESGTEDISHSITKTKEKILSLAISGKLVPQDPSDEPAIELLRRINPNFKPCDNSHYENLPNGWVCAMGKDIIRLLSGRDLPPSKFNAKQRGIPYLTGASNIDNHKIHITRWTDYPEVISSKDDVLISCKGTVGEIVINNIGEIHIARQFMALRTAVIIPEYLSLLMQGKVSLLKDSAKGVIPGISREDILNLEIAIPPFAEQHRIVESVGTFMGLVNKILC